MTSQKFLHTSDIEGGNVGGMRVEIKKVQFSIPHTCFNCEKIG